MMAAFEISFLDVEVILRRHAQRIDPDLVAAGKTIPEIAEECVDHIDGGAVERLALRAGAEIGEQTNAAYAEILRQLESTGVLLVCSTRPRVFG